MDDQILVLKDFLSSLVETQDRVKNVQKKLRETDDRNLTCITNTIGQQPILLDSSLSTKKSSDVKNSSSFPSSSSSNKENNRNTNDVRRDEKEVANLKHQLATMQAELIQLRNKARERKQHDHQVESLKQQLMQVRRELQIANESSREILRRYETEMNNLQSQLQIAMEANTALGKQVVTIEHEKKIQQASLSDVKSNIVLLQFETEEYKMQYNELTDILRDLTG